MTPITCISLFFKARTSRGTALAFSAKVIIIQNVSYYLFLYFLLIVQWSHFCYDSSYPSALDTTTAIGDSVEDRTGQYSPRCKPTTVCIRAACCVILPLFFTMRICFFVRARSPVWA